MTSMAASGSITEVPEFGWWDMTDQFALARMDALEVNRGSASAPVPVHADDQHAHPVYTDPAIPAGLAPHADDRTLR